MATRTTREITLPPEIVALVLSFKPVASHPDRTWDRRLWEPIIFEYRGETTLFHKCCGKGWYDRSNVCTQIAKGMYHPGTLEKWTRVTRREHGKIVGHPDQKLAPGRFYTDPILRWSCCGALVESRAGRVKRAPPGCTRLDLTLRITTITRASQADAEQNA